MSPAGRMDSAPVAELSALVAQWQDEDVAPEGDPPELGGGSPPPEGAPDHVPQWLLGETALPGPRGQRNARDSSHLERHREALLQRIARTAAVRLSVEREEELVRQLSPLNRRLQAVEERAIELATQLAGPDDTARIAEAERALLSPQRRLAAQQAAGAAAAAELVSAEAALEAASAELQGLPSVQEAAAARSAVLAAEKSVRSLTQRQLDEVCALLPTPPAVVRRALAVVWGMLHPEELCAAAGGAAPALSAVKWRDVAVMLRRREELLVALGDARTPLALAEYPQVEQVLRSHVCLDPPDGPLKAEAPSIPARGAAAASLRRLSAAELQGTTEDSGVPWPSSGSVRDLTTLSLRQLATARGVDPQGSRGALVARLEDSSRPPPPLTLPQVERASRPVAMLFQWARARLMLLHISREHRGSIEACEARELARGEAEARCNRANQRAEAARCAAADSARSCVSLTAEVSRLQSELERLRRQILHPPRCSSARGRPPSAPRTPVALATRFRGSWPLIGAVPAALSS
eukprot:TRINITY_DN16318_c0_g1_i1.p1 TRINITY_DN16318_c0_g1~~TRINITY_DN16318_c0_g1_i1.p1  ORF type:complete len:549 (+),score=127.89 TRINITY_DN16318_c0_g1_i1:75-1649(+)